MMSITEMKKRLRERFRDDYGIQWSDTLLDEILSEAQREYALYSGLLVGKCDIVTIDSPVLSLPENFIQAIKLTTPSGEDIPFISYRTLIERYGDFRKIKGNRVEYCCLNFDGFGKLRLFPQVPNLTFVGTLYYKRLPLESETIITNVEAIEQYAMFLMYQFTGKKLANNCYSSFMEAIHREQRHKSVFGSKKVLRKGVYY